MSGETKVWFSNPVFIGPRWIVVPDPDCEAGSHLIRTDNYDRSNKTAILINGVQVELTPARPTLTYRDILRIAEDTFETQFERPQVLVADFDPHEVRFLDLEELGEDDYRQSGFLTKFIVREQPYPEKVVKRFQINGRELTSIADSISYEELLSSVSLRSLVGDIGAVSVTFRCPTSASDGIRTGSLFAKQVVDLVDGMQFSVFIL